MSFGTNYRRRPRPLSRPMRRALVEALTTWHYTLRGTAGQTIDALHARDLVQPFGNAGDFQLTSVGRMVARSLAQGQTGATA